MEPTNARRTRRGFPRIRPPDDPKKHGQDLLDELEETRLAGERAEAGFDTRLLAKVTAEGLTPEGLEAIPGVRVVAQEDEAILIAFVDEAGKQEFENRLVQLARGERPTRVEVLYAIKAIQALQPEDRMGSTLRAEKPVGDRFALDVELWPLEVRADREALIDSFKSLCGRRDITILDTIARDALVLIRVKASQEGLDALLSYRDVRTVDLPPRVRLDVRLARIPLEDIPPVDPPPANAPTVAVLDSGLATGHPLLAPAIGDSQSFLSGKEAQDENGHGTMVAGLVLYGNVEVCAERRQFVPQLRLLSGRISDENNQADELIENQVTRAVEYFVANYGCRVFNLSVGDARRPYRGGRIGPWASLLDDLAREALHNSVRAVRQEGGGLSREDSDGRAADIRVVGV